MRGNDPENEEKTSPTGPDPGMEPVSPNPSSDTVILPPVDGKSVSDTRAADTITLPSISKHIEPDTGVDDRKAEPQGWPVPGWTRFHCVQLLGTGAMGRVFKAWDPALNRHVAVKFILSPQPDLVRRFIREAQSQARVDHPNICRVYEAGEAEGHPYIAMQYIDGNSLHDLCGDISTEQAVLLIRAVAEGMHEAHRMGLIHRDLKPSNIMVERAADGLKPYVVDFGLVRDMDAGETLTLTAAVVGTPMFMSPEQARGERRAVDRRTDVYALGATLYVLLVGETPFEAGSPLEIVMRVINTDPKPLRSLIPTVAADLETVVMKCLEKQPQRRYASARELADDLGRFLDGQPVKARPAGWWYRMRRKAARHKARVTAAVVALLALGGAAGYGIHVRLEAREAARLAQQFGREAERIDASLRAAYLIPLHDVRPAEREAVTRLNALAAADREAGGIARGGLAYARGVVDLRLGHYDEARLNLETARREGPETPALCLSLGLAYARLYQRELRALQSVAQPELRTARRRQAEQAFRDPAAAFLRQAQGALHDAPEYLAAVLAWCEDRREEARQKARAAVKSDPSLYEARQLEGIIFQTEGSEAAERGVFDRARTGIGRAISVLEEAARVGESDPQGYLQLAEAHSVLCEMELNDAGGDPRPSLVAGLQAVGAGRGSRAAVRPRPARGGGGGAAESPRGKPAGHGGPAPPGPGLRPAGRGEPRRGPPRPRPRAGDRGRGPGGQPEAGGGPGARRPASTHGSPYRKRPLEARGFRPPKPGRGKMTHLPPCDHLRGNRIRLASLGFHHPSASSTRQPGYFGNLGYHRPVGNFR